MVEGVAGLPGVGGEGVVWVRGEYVVEDDGLRGGGGGGVFGAAHFGCLLWFRWWLVRVLEEEDWSGVVL